MPQIIALSDYDNLTKAFDLPIDLSNQFQSNLKVRDNICRFILGCNFIDETDKIAYADDLAKLLFDFYQSGISISKSELNSLGKSKRRADLIQAVKQFY